MAKRESKEMTKAEPVRARKREADKKTFQLSDNEWVL